MTTACDSTTEVAPDLRIEIVSGSDQTGGTGSTLTAPVTVRVTDSSGKPVAGAEVRWRAIEGGGSVTAQVDTTDANGLASVLWIVGNEPGQQLLLATAGKASATIRAQSSLTFIDIAAGFAHTCVLTSLGEAFCWGANGQGQLGNGTNVSTSKPTRVGSSARFKRISAGFFHTCAISDDDALYCWGDNTQRQLGPGASGSNAHVPVRIALAGVFGDIAAGFVHTCATTVPGELLCWGSNGNGQLGGTPQNDVVRISTSHFTRVAAGEFHSCSIRKDNVLFCWGWNPTGEVGVNAPLGATVTSPTPVYGSVNYTAAAAGVRHGCAISVQASVYCWGRNATGETGLDPLVTTAVPSPVVGATGYTAVTTGNIHACGLSDQRAFCWGGLLGNGTTGTSKSPVAVTSTLSFKAISAGYDHVCAISADQIWCWGSNSQGQLGRAGAQPALAPVRVDMS